jgi:hypothetical protein
MTRGIHPTKFLATLLILGVLSFGLQCAAKDAEASETKANTDASLFSIETLTDSTLWARMNENSLRGFVLASYECLDLKICP